MPARIFVNLLLVFSLSTACHSGVNPAPETKIGTKEFFRLIAALSEPEGYFDTDNFVSNERAYLKIFPAIQRQAGREEAYIGVGPDQNYSYIAHLKPQIAFIIDIRRQNALQHLYFKALFQQSADRIQYLERLFGRKLGNPLKPAQTYGVSDLLQLVDTSRPDPDFAEEKVREALAIIRSWNPGLIDADYEAIRSVAGAFVLSGPDLKFTSFNRPPRSQHPSYRQLLEETDAEGTESNFLASEADFLLLKMMHYQNRIVPVVGDLSGPHALMSIGEEIRRRNLALSCFYVSNVEFYLFGRKHWESYVQNLGSLPCRDNTFLIRSYPQYLRPDLISISAYYMGTVFQSLQQFLADERTGRNQEYWDLIQHSRVR